MRRFPRPRPSAEPATPVLRVRLSRGCLPEPRKPWASGGRGWTLQNATRAGSLTSGTSGVGNPHPFDGNRSVPLPKAASMLFQATAAKPRLRHLPYKPASLGKKTPSVPLSYYAFIGAAAPPCPHNWLSSSEPKGPEAKTWVMPKPGDLRPSAAPAPRVRRLGGEGAGGCCRRGKIAKTRVSPFPSLRPPTTDHDLRVAPHRNSNAFSLCPRSRRRWGSEGPPSI